MKNLFVIMIASMVTMSAFAQGKDVVDIAIGSADHTTLVAAVKAADLVATLKSDGPFTVFAPTNAAFAKLPAGTVEIFSSLRARLSYQKSLPIML
jgi:uncharacterized surface protein with fasciclin (FAS1) repeats